MRVLDLDMDFFLTGVCELAKKGERPSLREAQPWAEAEVRAFLEKHPEFVPETSADYLPEPLRARCENGMAQFLSHRDHVEGFFIARMRRKGV